MRISQVIYYRLEPFIALITQMRALSNLRTIHIRRGNIFASDFSGSDFSSTTDFAYVSDV